MKKYAFRAWTVIPAILCAFALAGAASCSLFERDEKKERGRAGRNIRSFVLVGTLDRNWTGPDRVVLLLARREEKRSIH